MTITLYGIPNCEQSARVAGRERLPNGLYQSNAFPDIWR